MMRAAVYLRTHRHIRRRPSHHQRRLNRKMSKATFGVHPIPNKPPYLHESSSRH